MMLIDELSTASATPDELLALTARGDRAAFALLYDQTIDRTLGLITGVVRDPAQSEKVAHEVYLELWQHAARHSAGTGSALSVLLTLARRRAIDQVRAAAPASARRGDIRGPKNVMHDATTQTASPESVRAGYALERLTPFQRHVIGLVHDELLTHQQAALRLGVPTGTVAKSLRDGMVALRRGFTEAV